MKIRTEKIQPNGMLPIPEEVQAEFHLTPGTEVKFVDRGSEVGIKTYGFHHPRLRYEDYVQYHLNNEMKCNFSELEKITDRWGFIRQIYMENMKDIMMCSEENIRGNIGPYILDWAPFFSPIEADTWNSIRGRGIPLYPQFPVFNFFIDFANPYAKIGLELDGRKFHNSQKDTERDQMLLKYGWRIFRVTGSECTFPSDPEEWANEEDIDEDERLDRVTKWIMETNDGVVFSIGAIYFGRPKTLQEETRRLCLKSLATHRLTDFALPQDSSDIAVRVACI
jgi:hypothetical protein